MVGSGVRVFGREISLEMLDATDALRERGSLGIGPSGWPLSFESEISCGGEDGVVGVIVCAITVAPWRINHHQVYSERGEASPAEPRNGCDYSDRSVIERHSGN